MAVVWFRSHLCEVPRPQTFWCDEFLVLRSFIAADGLPCVFVNGGSKPSLEVEKLNDRSGGKIGIWGGDAGDGGYFANLKITKKPIGAD